MRALPPDLVQDSSKKPESPEPAATSSPRAPSSAARWACWTSPSYDVYCCCCCCCFCCCYCYCYCCRVWGFRASGASRGSVTLPTLGLASSLRPLQISQQGLYTKTRTRCGPHLCPCGSWQYPATLRLRLSGRLHLTFLAPVTGPQGSAQDCSSSTILV